MLTEALLGAVAEAVFSYLLEQAGLAEKLCAVLGRDPQRLAFQAALVRCPSRKAHPFRSQPQWIENRGPWMVWEVEDGWVVLVDQEGIASIRRVGDRSRGVRAGREQKPASNSRELARAIYPVCEGILEIERGMSGSVSS